MAKVTKEVIVSTTKEVARRALLPNALIVPLLIFVHWVVISVWFYFNYEHQTLITNLIIGLLGGSFSILTYSVWGLRRFLIKAYLIIHHNIVMLWLHPFCKRTAEQILNSNLIEDLEERQSSILYEWGKHLGEKAKELPEIFQRIIRYVLKRMGYSDELSQQIKMIKDKNTNEIANLISDEIAYRLIAASNRLVPAKIIYLIPINIVLVIILWFL